MIMIYLKVIPVYEQESMEIVLGIKQWQSYLVGWKFYVRVDQKALKFLQEQQVISGDY